MMAVRAGLLRIATPAGNSADKRDLSRLTAAAIYVLLGLLLVQVLFESWLQILLASRSTDGNGITILLTPDWPKWIKNGIYLALAFLTGIHILVQGTIRRFTTSADIAFAMLAVILLVIGFVDASSLLITGQGIYVYLRGVLVFYAIRAIDPPWSRVAPLLWVAGGIIVLNGLVSVIQLFVGGVSYNALGLAGLASDTSSRAIGLQDHPNHLGHIVGLMLLGMLAWFATRPKGDLRWWLVFVLLALSLAATQSRESLAGVIFGIVALAVLRRGRIKTLAMGTGLIFIVVGAIWIAQPANLQQLSVRLAGVISAFRLPSGSEAGVVCQPAQQDCTANGLPKREIRVLYVQQGIALWLRRPWFGYGIGQFGGIVAYEQNPQWYLDPRFGPHGFNTYGFDARQIDSFWLHLLVETGAVGTVAFVTWLILLGWPLVSFTFHRGGRSPASESVERNISATALWGSSALVFCAVIAGLSPALEDALIPPLLFGVIGLGWVLVRSLPTSSTSERSGELPTGW